MDCGAGSYITVVGSVSANDCQLCEAGKASATPTATSAATCEECVAGKFSGAIGIASCSPCASGMFSAAGAQLCTDACVDGTFATEDLAACCPVGEAARIDGSGCKARLLCADDEFLSSDDSSEEQVCKKCDNLTSIAMVVGSFLTFVGITYYVSDKVTVKSTMVQVKGMTT